MTVRHLGGGVLLAELKPVVDRCEWNALTRELLVSVRRSTARVLKVDLAGVERMNPEDVSALVNLATTANLLGVEASLTGVCAPLHDQLVRSPFKVSGLLKAA